MRIDRGYSDTIVVNEYVSENDALDLLPGQLIRGYPVYLFFFQGRKKALHSDVVKAMSRAAQTLYESCLFQGVSERFAGILASPVAVKDRSFELLPVLQLQFLYGGAFLAYSQKSGQEMRNKLQKNYLQKSVSTGSGVSQPRGA